MKIPLFINKSSLLHYLFPATCVLCGDKNTISQDKYHLDLCNNCYQNLPILQNACKCCSTPLPQQEIININVQTHIKRLCGTCLKKTPPFSKTIVPYFYKYPIDHFITQLKFRKQLLYARILGLLLAKHLQKEYQQKDKPHLIVPVPLHKHRLRERGFNQSLEIARPIATILNIPIDKYNCIRCKNTEPQSSLRAKDRHKNIHNAFTINTSFTGLNIAVIDDVITTGNTIREFCQQLQQCTNVNKIEVWACAHASR